MARFVKGQSGNPNGRPRKRRPNVSAFDIVFDKRLTVVENGVERQLTVDEVLQQQMYQAALKGNRPAVRQVLKMIERREKALQVAAPPIERKPVALQMSHTCHSAEEAMLLLDILWPDLEGEAGPRPLLIQTWAAQAAISRPGSKGRSGGCRENLNLFVRDFGKVRMPRGQRR